MFKASLFKSYKNYNVFKEYMYQQHDRIAQWHYCWKPNSFPVFKKSSEKRLFGKCLKWKRISRKQQIPCVMRFSSQKSKHPTQNARSFAHNSDCNTCWTVICTLRAESNSHLHVNPSSGKTVTQNGSFLALFSHFFTSVFSLCLFPDLLIRYVCSPKSLSY
jgi:hypothetical protein